MKYNKFKEKEIPWGSWQEAGTKHVWKKLSLPKREIRSHFSLDRSPERMLFHAAASSEHIADSV